MRSVSVRLADLENIKINLGYVGENEHVHILFDCKKAFDQYPNAVPSMVVVPPKGDAYPAVVTREGDIVEWIVTDSDLIYHGNGKIQLQFEQNDVVMKSAEARTFIAQSSIPTGTIPTPIQNWIAQANAILAEIPEDINSALAAAKASGEFDGDDGVGIASIAKTGTSGLVDTYTITLTNGSHYDIDVTNGTPGVGIQNIAKTSTVGLVDTYTITLTNGDTYPFTVTNGQNGVEIDDTTPAVNKVFSSSKVDQELTDVKTDIQGKYEKPSGGIPATDIAPGVIPTVPTVATQEQIKGGTDDLHPIAPIYQHESVFYALAKLVGEDMAQSSNPVGKFTDSAKTAIQKMLGIYESPWQLIRNDTFTNATESDLEITVDDNGEPFELTDIVLEIKLPVQQTQASIGNNGIISIYDKNNNEERVFCGAVSENPSDTTYKIAFVEITQSKGLFTKKYTRFSASGNQQQLTIYANNTGNKEMPYRFSTAIFSRILIKNVTGTVNIQLYGKRKWN